MVRPSPKWCTTTDRSDFNVHLLSRRRISVLSHVSRLDDDTPANVALRDDDDGDRVRVKYGGRCPQWLISGGRYSRGANVIHSSSSPRDLYGSSRTCDSAARRRRVASRRVTCINHRLIFDIVSHLRVAPERGGRQVRQAIGSPNPAVAHYARYRPIIFFIMHLHRRFSDWYRASFM